MVLSWVPLRKENKRNDVEIEEGHQYLGVRDQQIISNNLHLLTHACSDLRVVCPVILVEGVLNRENRVFAHKGIVQFDEVISLDFWASIIVLQNRWISCKQEGFWLSETCPKCKNAWNIVSMLRGRPCPLTSLVTCWMTTMQRNPTCHNYHSRFLQSLYRFQLLMCPKLTFSHLLWSSNHRSSLCRRKTQMPQHPFQWPPACTN